MSAKSPNTRRNRLLNLRWFQRALRQEMGLHLRLVAKNAQIEQVRSVVRQWTQEEVEWLYDRLRSHNPAVADAIQYGAGIGLRPSEIVNARVEHYDASTGRLHVPGRKFAHTRDVVVPEHLRPGLQQLAANRSPGEQLYPSVTPRKMRETLADCRKHLGVDGDRRSLTAFRSTFAQGEYDRARASGMSDGDARRWVAEQLGHGNINRVRIDVAKAHYLQSVTKIKLVRKGK